jgi:hypothetical protein
METPDRALCFLCQQVACAWLSISAMFDIHVQRYLPGSVQKAADTSDSAHEQAPAALHFTKHAGGGGGPQ